MADNDVRDLEQAAPQVEKPPQPRGEQKPIRGEAVGAEADGPALPGSEDAVDSLVRSIYASRLSAPEASSAGDFSQMETTDAGFLVRGAFLAHITEGQGEAAGDHDHIGEELLRAAYVKRITTEPAPRKRAAPARKTAAKKQAAKKQAARLAARNGRGKAKPVQKRKARSNRVRGGKRPRR
jgi:hypothetical protein